MDGRASSIVSYGRSCEAHDLGSWYCSHIELEACWMSNYQALRLDLIIHLLTRYIITVHSSFHRIQRHQWL